MERKKRDWSYLPKSSPLRTRCTANHSSIPAEHRQGSTVRVHLALALSVATIFAPFAQATQIRQFDRFQDEDQIAFVSKLVESVKAAAQSDRALLARVNRFFMKKQPGETISGMGRFELNLSLARIADMDTAAKNPQARHMEVEDVMYATLFNNGIRFTSSFRPTAVNFQAQKPLTRHVSRQDADRALAETRQWIARTVAPDRDVTRDELPDSKGWSGFSDDQKAIAFWAALIAVGALLGSAGAGDATPSAAGSSLPPPDDPSRVMRDAHRSACAATLDPNCRDPFGNHW